MIYGSGSVSKLLNDREEFLFFAAGVSDSLNKDTFQFAREGNTLTSNNIIAKSLDKMLVYFSSISIFTHSSLYTKHKVGMERIVKDCFENYTILRIGNIWECTNPNTFINAHKRQPYEPRDEYKYMISKEQLNFITNNLPLKGKHEISIFGEMKKVKDCL
jgi:hypothetical protein